MIIATERLFNAQAQTAGAGPIEHLFACHRRIEERLASFVKVGDFLKERTAEALATVGQNVRFMRESGALHTEDEEVSVFPRLLAKISPEDAHYLEALEQEHIAAEDALAKVIAVVEQIREVGATTKLVNAYEEAARRLAEIYRIHIASEDAHLLRLARMSLTAEDLDVIQKEMRARRHAA